MTGLPMIMGSSGRAALVTAGLVGEWRFNDGAGQVLTDHSGNGYHGQLGTAGGADASDPAWVSGGLRFDGADDHVAISDGTALAALNSLGNLTIDIVFKINAIAGSDYILRCGLTTDIKYSVFLNSQRQISFFSHDGSGFQGASSPSGVVALSLWHRLVVRRTSGGSLKAELNGRTLFDTTITMPAAGTPAAIRFGRGNDTQPFNGDIAFAAIYPGRVLSDAEVAQNKEYLTGLLATRGITIHDGLVTDGLAGEWRFDTNTGQSLLDLSGNGYNGQLGSSSGADASDPAWVTEGLRFDGSDDHVQITSGTALAALSSVGNLTIDVVFNAGTGAASLFLMRCGLTTDNKYAIVIATTRAIRFDWHDGSAHTNTSSSTNVVAASTWYRAVVRRSSSGALTVTLNDVLVINTNISMPGAGTPAALRFGRGADSQPFNGDIAFLAIYPGRVLSDAEVAQNKRHIAARLAPRGIVLHDSLVTDGLAGEWRFDAGTGQTLTDHSGNGYHGQLGTSSGADGSDPVWVSEGLRFDGTDDHVQITNSTAVAALSSAGDLTLDMVFKPAAVADGIVPLRCGVSNDNRYSISFTSNGGIRFNWYTGTTHTGVSSGGGIVTASTWYRLVVRRSSGGSLIVLLNDSTVINTTISMPGGSAPAEVRFGRGSTSQPFNGDIAFIAIYPGRVLSDAEVAQNKRHIAARLAPRGIVLP